MLLIIDLITIVEYAFSKLDKWQKNLLIGNDAS